MPSDTNAGNSGQLLDADGHAIHKTVDQVEGTGDQIVDYIQRQPITAALVIFVTGYILGKIT